MKNALSREKSIETVLVITTGFMLLFLWTQSIFWLYMALGLSVIGLLSNTLLNGIVFIWSKVGEVLGYVNSRILLTLVYVLIVIPMAVLRKIFRVPSKIILSKKVDTYYSDRNHLFAPKDFENPW